MQLASAYMNSANKHEAEDEVEQKIRETQPGTINEVAGELKNGDGLVQSIIHEVMQFKISHLGGYQNNTTSTWKNVLKMFMKLFLEVLKLKEMVFCDVYVSRDDCWVSYFQQETKRASKKWRHCFLPKPNISICRKLDANPLLGL